MGASIRHGDGVATRRVGPGHIKTPYAAEPGAVKRPAEILVRCRTHSTNVEAPDKVADIDPVIRVTHLSSMAVSPRGRHGMSPIPTIME
jgi:hypothetical protein